MRSQNFSINTAPFLKKMTLMMLGSAWCALLLWQAPWLYRSIVMGLALLYGLGHYWKLSSLKPYVLSFKEETWYLNERPVEILASSRLSGLYVNLCLKTGKKKYYIFAPYTSFESPQAFHHVIRLVKIYRGPV